MFRYITESPSRVGTRRAYVPLSIVAHLALVGLAIVVPIFGPDVLPVAASAFDEVFISRDMPQPPLPPQAPPVRESAPHSQPPDADVDPFAAPIVPPAAVAPETVGQTTRGLIRGVEDGVGNIVDGTLGTRVDVPPLPPQAVEPDMPRRVGGEITKPKKIHDATPVYPTIAIASHVAAPVVIEATIGPTGDVLDAKVLHGHPLLDRAALDAVRQWRFTPTLLNGKAIAVIMTVTVDFKLQ